MAQRGFEHSDNPPLRCSDGVLLLPSGRRSFLPAEPDRRYRGLADERIRRAFDHGLATAVRALGG